MFVILFRFKAKIEKGNQYNDNKNNWYIQMN